MFLTSPQTRVVIAEGHALVRGAITALLDAEDDITVAGVAGDSDEAFAVTERERPDVVLMDLNLPGVDGLEATQADFLQPRSRGRARHPAQPLR